MKTHSIKRPPQQPMQCNICKKVFSRASSLNTHMISHTAKLYCYACSINFDDDVQSYSQHMQSKHFVTMTKDCMSRTRINLQQQQSEHPSSRVLNESLASIVKVEPNEITSPTQQSEKPQVQPQQRIMEVFQVQSTNVPNGQIPKLKITLKKEPIQTNAEQDGNESDSSSTSNSSSGSSSSSSSGSSSSSSSDSNGDQDNN